MHPYDIGDTLIIGGDSYKVCVLEPGHACVVLKLLPGRLQHGACTCYCSLHGPPLACCWHPHQGWGCISQKPCWLTLLPHLLCLLPLLCQVDEINIQFTTLINGSNARVFYPNQQLMSQPFANQSISGNKGESFKVRSPNSAAKQPAEQLGRQLCTGQGDCVLCCIAH